MKKGWLKYLISLIATLTLGAYAYAYMIDCKTNKLTETVSSHIVMEEATLKVIQDNIPKLLEQIEILNKKMGKEGD